LLSNLKSTIRECVHLVTLGHFRSRDKDGGRSHHSIYHSPKPHAARKVHGCAFNRNGVIANQRFTLRE